MRIKSLTANDVFGIKDLSIELQETDDIICVIDENENPFDDHAFMRVMESLFLNVFYHADFLCGNGEIRCLCERFNQNFLITLKGKKEQTEIIYRDKKWTGQTNGVEETCFCGEEVGGKFKWVLRTDYREILYPSELREFCIYDKNLANNAMEEIVGGIHSKFSDSAWLSEEEGGLLKSKTQEYLAECEGVPFLEGQPLTMNAKGELIFQERYSILDAEEYFSKDEYARIQFLYWLASVHLSKRLCETLRHDGDLPIFIKGLFEQLDKDTNKAFLFEEMRKTGRQVFILLNAPDENVEKYCDKTVRLSIQKG